MYIKDIWNVLYDYGNSTLIDSFFSTAAAYSRSSFYTKIKRFLETLSNNTNSDELTLSETYHFVNCIYSTDQDSLYGIEKKLYYAIDNMIPFQWRSAARILIKNNMMSEDFWLLCSQHGNRGLSYIEILPVLKALCTTNDYVIEFLKRSSFSFDAKAHIAGFDNKTVRENLHAHRNLFCIVLFTYKTQRLLEEVLSQPEAENIILSQMIIEMNNMGQKLYEALRHWTLEDLREFAMNTPGGPDNFTPTLSASSMENNSISRLSM